MGGKGGRGERVGEKGGGGIRGVVYPFFSTSRLAGQTTKPGSMTHNYGYEKFSLFQPF